MLVGETDGAVKLDAGLGHQHGVLRRFGFGGDGQRGIDAIGLIVGRNLKDQRACRLGADISVDRLMLQRLEAADRLAELLAEAQVVEGDLLRLFHHAKQFGGQREQCEMMELLDSIARRRMRSG